MSNFVQYVLWIIYILIQYCSFLLLCRPICFLIELDYWEHIWWIVVVTLVYIWGFKSHEKKDGFKVKRFGKVKLEDGRGPVGRDKLTNKEIDKLQEHYDLAIKSGSNLVRWKKCMGHIFSQYLMMNNRSITYAQWSLILGVAINKARALNRTHSLEHGLAREIMTTILKNYQDSWSCFFEKMSSSTVSESKLKF